MRKLLTCLCIFTICLGVFTGCADNRVPQPDEGTEGFVDLDAYLQELQEEGIPVMEGPVEYKEVESVVKNALSTAGISTDFEFVTCSSGGKPLSECALVLVCGRVAGKPMSLTLLNRDGNLKCLSISSPGNDFYYWSPPNPNRTGPTYDFYTGKPKEQEQK